MKLLMNTESLLPPLTGIGNYTLNLLKELHGLRQIERIECFSGSTFASLADTLAHCQLATQRYHHKGTAAAKDDAANPPKPPTDWRAVLRRVPFAYQAREAWRNALLRASERKRLGAVYHEPNFILKAYNGPKVATIHDLSVTRYPQYHPAERVEWIGKQLANSLDAADFLITPSEIIRQELIDDFGVAPERVRSTYLGASAEYRPRDAAQTMTTLSRYGLRHGGYVLFIGSLEPRKGVDLLIEAWCSLPAALRQEYPLLLAGAPGWRNQEMQARIDALKVSHGLRQLRYVPGEELPALYAGARLFVYPSRYEGFGLPVLEAMSCGAPALCTAATSMAEFSAGATALFENGDASALAGQMQALLDDDQRSANLARRGLQRAADFSWRRCAEQTLAIYRLVQP
jgi:glycosyltransferase involved in cell wall biosynthesis